VDTAAENIYFKEEQEYKSPLSGTDFKHSSSSYKLSSEEKSSDSKNSILN
jgi:hypothetical protein